MKNYSGMIALFKQLHHSKLAGTDARLHIYGEGSMKSSLEQEAEKKQAPVLFKGRTNNMANLLPKYDAYISTSIYEGYGIAPMEALACGLPIFISDIPVYREVYGGYAFYIDLTDHSGKSFLSAVEAYQQLTPQQKKLHQQQGMEHAAAMAGDKAYINRLLDLYEA